LPGVEDLELLTRARLGKRTDEAILFPEDLSDESYPRLVVYKLGYGLTVKQWITGRADPQQFRYSGPA
jgi:hypothetical protein